MLVRRELGSWGYDIGRLTQMLSISLAAVILVVLEIRIYLLLQLLVIILDDLGELLQLIDLVSLLDDLKLVVLFLPL